MKYSCGSHAALHDLALFIVCLFWHTVSSCSVFAALCVRACAFNWSPSVVRFYGMASTDICCLSDTSVHHHSVLGQIHNKAADNVLTMSFAALFSILYEPHELYH